MGWIFLGLSANLFVGAIVCSYLDTDDKAFFNWYKLDPTPWSVGQMIVLTFWPVMAVLMIIYKKDRDRCEERISGIAKDVKNA